MTNPYDQYTADAHKFKLLDADQEYEIGRRVRDGDADARQQMIQCNLRLVASIAKRYKNNGLSGEDLIAYGNVGLIIAVDRYDPEQGNRFSTYATHWIKQTIRRSLDEKSKTVRIPTWMVQALREYKKIEKELSTPDYTPDFDAITEAMGKTAEQKKLIKSAMNTKTRSLQAAAGGGSNGGTTSGGSRAHAFPDNRIKNPLDIIALDDMVEKLHRMLATATPRNAQIVRMRFGIGQPEPMTLEEVAKMYGLTRERVRQIVDIELKKLMLAWNRRPMSTQIA